MKSSTPTINLFHQGLATKVKVIKYSSSSTIILLFNTIFAKVITSPTITHFKVWARFKLITHLTHYNNWALKNFKSPISRSII